MSEVPKHPWLSKRGNVYRVRAPVPKDIVKTFGRREATYSLGTKDACEARKKIDVEAAKIRRQFDEHRDQQQPSIDSKPVSAFKVPLSPFVLQQICDQHYQSIIDEDFEWRADLLDQVREDGEGFGDGQYIDHPQSEWYNVIYEKLEIDDLLLLCVREEHERRLAAAEKLLSLADVAEHSALADRYSSTTLTPSDRRKLARKLLESEIQARKDVLTSDQSRYDAILDRHTPTTVQQLVGAEASTDGDPGPILSSLFDAFEDEGRREGLEGNLRPIAFTNSGSSIEVVARNRRTRS